MGQSERVISRLELIQLVQNLLLDAFEFLILEDLVIIVGTVFVVVLVFATVAIAGTAHSTAATWSADPLVSPLVQQTIIQL